MSRASGDDPTVRLVSAAKAGDASAFSALYERIAPALYTWADLRIRPAHRAWIEPGDVVQEVWCRAWSAFERFDPERTSFRYWIFRIAKNVLLEGVRKASDPAFRQGAGTSERAFALANVPDDATAISRRVARTEGLDLLREWLEALDEEDRTLALWVGLEGLPHQLVAERLDLEREAVSKRWQRLRRRLAEMKVPKEVLAALD